MAVSYDRPTRKDWTLRTDMTLQTLHGSCRCGQVRIEAQRAPVAAIRCYCRSCRTAGIALSQLPGAESMVEPDGGTDYSLFRKDRVHCVSGQGLLAEHRLKPSSPTRRVVATCCNPPVFLDFTRGHWLSLYCASLSADGRPTVSQGVMAKHRIATPATKAAFSSHPALPPALRSSLLASTRVVVFVGTPMELARGLTPLIGAELSAKYACTSYRWYLVCAAGG